MGSAIGILIRYRIEVRPESSEIDSRRPSDRIGDDRSRDEPPRRNGSELGDRNSVTGYDDRTARLDLSQHRRGVIAELPLGDDLAHGE